MAGDLPDDAVAYPGEPHPEGNPALAAATEAIIRRRLAAGHYQDPELARLTIALDALPDAAVALTAALPALSKAIAAQAQQEAVHRHVAEQDAIHADLGQLLVILGLGDYARPQSPHEVFQMCLARLREMTDADYRNPDGSYHTSPPALTKAIDGQARAHERAHCVQLAVEHNAVVFAFEASKVTGEPGWYTPQPFADLLKGDTDA